MEARRAFPAAARLDPIANLDWRLGLPPEARRRNVGEILDLLMRNLPVPDPEGTGELRKIATCFEERIYNSATSQVDYSRKISAKLRSMEMKINRAVQNQNHMDPDRTELGMSELSEAPAVSEDSSQSSS